MLMQRAALIDKINIKDDLILIVFPQIKTSSQVKAGSLTEAPSVFSMMCMKHNVYFDKFN